MMNLSQLYNIADNNKIQVYHYDLSPIKSMSVPGVIGIDANFIKTNADEKEQLAHELGHCMLGAFYTGSSPLELRAQKEYRANKWAIEKLIPFAELIEACKSGIIEIWELAEYFGVSEALVKSAFKLYESKFIELQKYNYSE